MLNPDYRDMLSAFANAGVEYLVIGAYALAAHGHPRATGDLDLWVRPTASNAQRVLDALRAFGAPMSSLSPNDFTHVDRVLQLGIAPRRIDILTSIDGVAFADAWPERLNLTLDGILTPVLSRRHLIKNKAALGRPQDLADIERLRQSGG